MVGVRYKCKVCEDFDFCENCFANRTDHDHPFVAYHRSKAGQQPLEAGRAGQSRIQWCQATPEGHQAIKEITTSSNEHMAAKMMNKEIGMPWISEKAFGPVSSILSYVANIILMCVERINSITYR